MPTTPMMKVGIAKMAEITNNLSVRSASFCCICLDREWMEGDWYNEALKGCGARSSIVRMLRDGVGIYRTVVSHSDPLMVVWSCRPSPAR